MEKNHLKKCKVCGAEVAKNAKTCPHCGAKLKKGHPILVGILILVVLVVAFGSSDGDEPKMAENTAVGESAEFEVSAQETTPEQEEKTEFHVGETAELKGVKATLVNVTESDGSDFNTPTEGNVFVICEFEIENNSDSEINISSAMSFNAYCDDYTCTFSLGALLEKGDKNQLDGTVAPGKKFNGIIGYEVPSDWGELEIAFTPNVWSGKDIVFIAENG